MKAIIAAGLILILLNSASAQSSFSKSVQKKLKSAGFKCTSVDLGTSCTIKKVNSDHFNYPLPITVLVPKNLQKINTVHQHFHGYQNVCRKSTIRDSFQMLKSFNIDQQFLKSEPTDRVLVAPLSLGKVKHFKSGLLPQFAQYSNWINSLLNAKNSSWDLSGHSAGGFVVNQAAKRIKNPVSNITLLDATSSKRTSTTKVWRAIKTKNPTVKFTSIYRPGSATQQGSLLLKQALKDKVTLKKSRLSHCKIPAHLFPLKYPEEISPGTTTDTTSLQSNPLEEEEIEGGYDHFFSFSRDSIR